MRIVALDKESKQSILNDLLKRSPNNYSQYESTVNQIIDRVRAEGDKALFDYTQQFDKFTLTAENIRVTKEEIAEAYTQMDENLIDVIRQSAENIRAFHQKQLRNSWFDAKPDGTILGMKITAIERAGVYVPGGKAAYPSSVLMNVIPAKVAGVDEIIMTTPPGKDGKVNPGTLVAADIAGVDTIYKVGGAQAIAAMAFGTESVPKVDKITGPGNIFVALAKKAVYGYVSIDSIAGPSEILVLADETATPRYVAADLLSQAEHDELSGLYNKGKLNRYAEEVFDVAMKNRLLLGVLFVDIDEFKQMNDRYGHRAGDACVQAVAECIRSCMPEDFAARYGGDEFVVITLNRGEEYVRECGEKLVQAVKNTPLTEEIGAGVLSVTVGAACAVPTGKNKIWDFMSAADNTLYEQKKEKRGCLRVGSTIGIINGE